jgi:hypothetical protein
MTMEHAKRLYMILYPNNALVGSMLPPDQFAIHYQVGSNRYYSGKLIFAEIDTAFRDPYFPIEWGLEALVPHADGRPKSTKFISSYRVLEHIDFKYVKNLYLATQEGVCLELKREDYDATRDGTGLRIFGELSPVRLVVLSTYTSAELANYITTPGNPKGCPKIFFTQIDVNVEEFVQQFRENPFIAPPVPAVHPSKLRDAVEELVREKKKVKGLSLNTSMGSMSFKKIANGFWMAAQNEIVFFRMPTPAEIEETNYKFFKSM